MELKPILGNKSVCFDVQDDGRLIFTPKENDLFRFCLDKEVTVIANDESNWVLHSDPQKVNYFWRIWIMERTPISRLTCNPGELYWKVWVQDYIIYVPFFQYSVRICTDLIESAKHCLWSCGFAMDIWK